jgi:DNA recombination protein RmuC
MDVTLVVALIAAAAALAALVAVLLSRRGGADQAGAQAREQAAREEAARAEAALASLAGRLGQMGETQAAQQAALSDRLQAQERALTKAIEERLADLGKRVGDRLQEQTTAATQSLSELKERLAVIDAAQKNITELSSQVVGLQDILANKQARGAFGEIQLNDLVQGALPPSAYEFQATLAGGTRADCLLKLPNPPGPIVVDAKFPLESYRALREALGAGGSEAALVQARRDFALAIRSHFRAIAERYIRPGETAESALMFLPSEAVYAELHANFPNVVEESFRARVWIVSPTTLMATLTTIRAVLKDVRMREQAGLIQKEVRILLDDVGRLDDRVGKLQRHFDQANEDIRQIRVSTEKVTKRGDRIEELELGAPEAETSGMLPPRVVVSGNRS